MLSKSSIHVHFSPISINLKQEKNFKIFSILLTPAFSRHGKVVANPFRTLMVSFLLNFVLATLIHPKATKVEGFSHKNDGINSWKRNSLPSKILKNVSRS